MTTRRRRIPPRSSGGAGSCRAPAAGPRTIRASAPAMVGSLDAGHDDPRCRCSVAANGDRVDDARFKVFGCSAAIASASLAADRVAGASLVAARPIDAGELADALDLPDEKRAMAAHAVAAVRAAMEDWERKSPNSGPAASG